MCDSSVQLRNLFKKKKPQCDSIMFGSLMAMKKGLNNIVQTINAMKNQEDIFKIDGFKDFAISDEAKENMKVLLKDYERHMGIFFTYYEQN